MIINMFNALKKIDEIIFKIFQDRYLLYYMKKINTKGEKRRNAEVYNNLNFIDNNLKNGKKQFNWLKKLRISKKKKENESISIAENSSRLFQKELSFKNLKESKKLKNKVRRKKMNNNINIYEFKKIIIHNNNNEQFQNDKSNDLLNLVNKGKNEIKEDGNINNQMTIEKHLRNLKIKGKNQGKKEDKTNNILNDNNPPKKKKRSIINEPIKKEFEIKECNSKKIKKKNSKKRILNESANYMNKKQKFKRKSNKNSFSLNGSIIKKKKSFKSVKKREKENEQKVNNIKYIDEELNLMNYEIALIHDKRNYLQYYWSLLKRKHIIILTFVSNDDYNVFLLKFSLFILSLALYFSINTLFYKESTLHEIFTKEGKYNLLYQIPQILYSTLISFAMTVILKALSLSQNELIKIKKELDYEKSKNLAEQAKKCLRIKLYSFFWVGLVLLFFFWYYISAFAAVYVNTQIHLIKDTLISFTISMLYPFLINLIPGIFRIIALKSIKKDKECLYKTGQIISYI